MHTFGLLTMFFDLTKVLFVITDALSSIGAFCFSSIVFLGFRFKQFTNELELAVFRFNLGALDINLKLAAVSSKLDGFLRSSVFLIGDDSVSELVNI